MYLQSMNCIFAILKCLRTQAFLVVVCYCIQEYVINFYNKIFLTLPPPGGWIFLIWSFWCNKKKKQYGYILAIWPVIKKIRALYFLQLWKLKKIKWPYFLDWWSNGWDIAILLFHRRPSIWTQEPKQQNDYISAIWPSIEKMRPFHYL